jgi:uncharacterized cupin superfamily protein
MSTASLVKLDTPVRPEEYHLPAEKLLHGNPKQTLWMQYTDPTRQLMVGLWYSEPGKWRIAYTEEEFCHMLEGHSILTDASGRSVSVVAGESFVVPRGFVGTWEVVQPTTKRFVIYERAEG